MPNNSIPQELKEQALIKLLPRIAGQLDKVSKDIGVANGTVFKWRKQLVDEGVLVPNEEDLNVYSAEQIFSFVLETATMSEHQLAEYCREKGLFVDEVKRWKTSCIAANLPNQQNEGM